MEEDQYDRRYSKIMKDLIADYSRKTTIQGIKYVADTSLTLIERFWWTIVVVLSVLCCGSLIFSVTRHHDQSPIIMSYANEETPKTHKTLVGEIGLFSNQILTQDDKIRHQAEKFPKRISLNFHPLMHGFFCHFSLNENWQFRWVLNN
jgi:Amiloride-sensitive sodium channel